RRLRTRRNSRENDHAGVVARNNVAFHPSLELAAQPLCHGRRLRGTAVDTGLYPQPVGTTLRRWIPCSVAAAVARGGGNQCLCPVRIVRADRREDAGTAAQLERRRCAIVVCSGGDSGRIMGTRSNTVHAGAL